MSGWVAEHRRRWRFYPARWPWGTKKLIVFVNGGDFVYED